MATFIEAFREYGPRLIYDRTATTAELAQTLAGRTGFQRGQMLMVLREQHEVLLQYASSGTPVELEGIGQVSPLAGLAALPIAAWEFSLGVYLIVKGFKPSPITDGMGEA